MFCFTKKLAQMAKVIHWRGYADSNANWLIEISFFIQMGNEPPHIHIETPDGECKFWLDPIKLARNKGSSCSDFAHY